MDLSFPYNDNPEAGGNTWNVRTAMVPTSDAKAANVSLSLLTTVKQSWTAGQAAAASTTAIHAAVPDNGSTQVVSGAAPPCGRNLSVTYGGTTGNITAVGPTATGKDMAGNPLTEALPVATAATGGTKFGTKIFGPYPISISVPANGTGVTTAIGTGSKLGLAHCLSFNTVTGATLNGTPEGTPPTVTTDPTDLYANGITLASALNGNPVTATYQVQ